MNRSNKRRSVFFFCLGTGAILLLIQAGGSLHGNRIVFPDVDEILQALIRLLSRGETYLTVGCTMLRLAETLLISMVLGILIGLAEGISCAFHSAVKPIMILIRSVPMIILIIVLMTVLKYEIVPIAAGVTVLIPLISEAVCEGYRSIDRALIDVYRLHSGLNLRVLFRVHLPLISGFLKQAFSNAAGSGLKIIVSAEYLVQARNSLGKAVYSSSYFLEYAEIYAYAFVMVLLVLLVTDVPVWLMKKADKRKILPIQ